MGRSFGGGGRAAANFVRLPHENSVDPRSTAEETTASRYESSLGLETGSKHQSFEMQTCGIESA